MNDQDLSLVLDWRNQENVRKYMYTNHIISKSEHEAWWESIKSRNDIIPLIFEFESQPNAFVSFSDITRSNQNASWAFYLSPSAKRGIGSLVEFFAIKYAFENLKLHKLKCEVLETNSSVIKLHKKFGFIEEGVFREEHRIEGRYIDIFRLGLLKLEWYQTSEKLHQKLIKIWKL